MRCVPMKMGLVYDFLWTTDVFKFFNACDGNSVTGTYYLHKVGDFLSADIGANSLAYNGVRNISKI